MITTVTLHKIHTTEERLKRNFYSAYSDIFTDNLKEDTVEFFEHDAHRLSSAIQTIDKHGFASLFRDGYTMMLLNPNDFEFVDKWFNKPGSADEELQIIIEKKNGSIEIVSPEDLSY